MLSYIQDEALFADYQVVLFAPTNDHYLVGIIEDSSISFAGTADYTEGSMSKLVNVSKNTLSGIAGGMAGLTKGRTSNMFNRAQQALDNLAGSVKTVAETMIGYDSPSRLPINLSFKVFPHRHGNGDVKSIVEAILFFTQYKQSDVIGNIESNLYSIGDLYENSKKQIMEGKMGRNFDPLYNQLISFTVGDYINTDGVFFAQSAVPTIATELDDNGVPLYVQADFSLISYRILTAQEIASWLKV